jgi:hypothetical protein
LEDTVRENKHRSAQAVYEAILDRAFDFAEPNDDVTLVVIKRTGASGGS